MMPEHIERLLQSRSIYQVRRAVRWRLWRDAPFCWYCGRFLFWRVTTIDHLQPRSDGGDDEKSNLKLCCELCNQRKGDLPIELIVCSVQRGRVLFPLFHVFNGEVRSMSGKVLEFNYRMVKNGQRKATQEHAKAIRGLLARSTASIIDIGRHVTLVRDNLGPELFVAWVHAEFQWSKAQAYNYKRVASVFGEAENIEQFQPTAIIELSRQHVDQRAIDAALKSAAAGEIVTRRSALALIEKYDTRTTATTNAAPRRIAQSSQSQPAATDDRTSSHSVSPASASPPTANDLAEQWRLAVEELRQ